MVIGYYLQKFIVYKLSSKYNESVVEDHGQYTSLLSYCFFPLQMFQYGFSLDAPVFLRNAKVITTLSVCSAILFIFLFSFLLSNISVACGLRPFGWWNLLAFAAAMGASDSAFMVPFLQSCGCCDHIIAILEGETVLSEVVAILVFRTVVELQINVVNGVMVLSGLWYFCSFLVNSFAIGIATSVLSSFLLKWLDDRNSGVNTIKVILFFCIPLITYMIGEGMHISSSISMRICGFIMSCYTQYNLNEETRLFVHKMVRFTGYFCEVCSFLVLGMISYNLQPFSVSPLWLLITFAVLVVSNYASITGVLATVMRWVEPRSDFLSHRHIAVLYIVYRGSVSFTLTARAEGELLQNDQVVLMMRLSLCVIWISLIQHVLFSCPYTGFQKFAKSIVSGEDEEAEVSDWMKRVQSRLGALLIRKESTVKSPLDMNDEELREFV
ncbi:hypothetical protein WA556_003852 [Blastocystis sp. ATCC 50177/Nand II]